MFLPHSRPSFEQIKKTIYRINPSRQSPVDNMMFMVSQTQLLSESLYIKLKHLLLLRLGMITYFLAAQMEKYSKNLEQLVAERTQELIAEQNKTAQLLHSECD